VETIRIPDRETGGWEITGEQIAHVSTEYGDPDQASNDRRPRWGVNTVWKLDNGQYALYRASMSVIYHTEGTSCRVAGPRGSGTGSQSGSPCLARDMPDNAEPCERCRPPWPEDLNPTTKVRYEFPRQSVEICEEPGLVIERMTKYRKHSGQSVSGASGPARELLAQCRANDPDFADARPPMTRIG
jgi:hypothetical protein